MKALAFPLRRSAPFVAFCARRAATVLQRLIPVLLSAGAVLCGGEAIATDWVRVESMGISAAGRVDDRSLLINWRFLKPGTPDLKEISGMLDGQPLATWQVQPYPGANDHTEVLFLLDLSDATREEQIRQDKIKLIRVAGRAGGPHFGAGIAIYASGPPRLLTAADDSVATLVNMLVGSQPVNGPAKMGEALHNSLEVLAAVPAQRRAIVLFSDGHSDDSIDVAKIIAEATRADTTITFVLSASTRSVARAPLEQIANATGGFVVDEAGFEKFLERPFVLTDSGGSARAELPPLKRYFWQDAPFVQVALRYDGGTLRLDVPVNVPAAGVGDTVDYVLGSPLVLAGAAGMVGIVVLAAIVLVRRRRPVATPAGAAGSSDLAAAGAPVSSGGGPVAVPPPGPSVEDISTGSTYALDGQTIRIGRARDNEIVLSDSTVSRLQAVIRRADDGIFEIENQSTLNPTLLNHALVERSALAEGDLISVGKVTLRFTAGSATR
jgi:hypothetical protein